jgi:uncharacterized membrane protein YgcG
MNKLSQQELWEKIKSFNLDDQNSSYPFSKKLASENNWSVSFTQQAIAEYKKFIFLCCIFPTGASPSETVDKVWHLHLTYTKNYWEDFCKNTLQQDVHHHPSKGGPGEKAKHVNWYEETLKLYQATFKLKPPAGIWPPASVTTEKIDETIYEPAYFKRVVLLFTVPAFLFICAVNLYHTKGPDFLLYYAVICAGGLTAIWFTQKNKEQRLQQIVFACMPQKFTVFEISRFLHGPHRCYQTAVVDLLKRGIIETSGNGYTIVSLPSSLLSTEQNPLLPSLIQYKNGDVFSYLEGMSIADSDTLRNPAFESLLRFSKKVDYPKFIIPGIVLLLGIARMLQGIANDKPVGFLVMIMIAFAGIALLVLEMHSYTKSVKDIVQALWERQNADGYGNDIIGNFSILGTAAIAGFAEYALLSSDFDFYEPKNQRWTGGEYTSSASSCSSGGDGGGCGSGCGGGCGGCGS